MRVTRPTHAAHVLACLRIDEDLTVPAARLATGLLGSALAGRDSHPLDDLQDFSDSATCLLPDQPCLVAPDHTPFLGIMGVQVICLWDDGQYDRN